MAEPRLKPSLRVDTRVAAPSASTTSSRQRPTRPAAVLSSTFTSAFPLQPPPADARGRPPDSPGDAGISNELAIWWDGEVIDESEAMLLRRGRLSITERRKRPSQSTKAEEVKAVPPSAASILSPTQLTPPQLSDDVSVHTLPVLIKTFKTKRPSSEAVLRLRYDFEAFQHLHFDAATTEGDRLRASSAAAPSATSGSPLSRVTPTFAGASPIPFIKPLHLLHDDVHGMALIYRDSGGRKLSHLVGTFLPSPPSLPSPAHLVSFLHCALALTDVLSALHCAGVIYRALCPANSLYDPSTRLAQLLDFSQSSLLSSEKQAVDVMAFPDNSLPYTAPEATGRMNRSIDTRSDLSDIITETPPSPPLSPLRPPSPTSPCPSAALLCAGTHSAAL